MFSTCFNAKNFYILPKQHIYVFHTMLIVKNNYFHNQHQLTRLCKDYIYFLLCVNQIINDYVDKFEAPDG